MSSRREPEFYDAVSTPLVLEQYFLGHLFAWGIFEDCLGRLRRSFQVDIEGRLENGQLVLDEEFLYNNGQREQRIWRISPLGNHRYQGEAQDVVGKAQGEVNGHRLHWQYQLDLPIGRRRVRVHFDDRMYLQPGGILINRARVQKMGLPLGTVTLFFQKREA